MLNKKFNKLIFLEMQKLMPGRPIKYYFHTKNNKVEIRFRDGYIVDYNIDGKFKNDDKFCEIVAKQIAGAAVSHWRSYVENIMGVMSPKEIKEIIKGESK